MTEDQLMTLEEAAAFLRVHPQTVRRLCRAHRIQYARVGPAYRFKRSALQAYIDGNTTEAVG